MPIVLRRKDNESASAFLRRFKSKMTQSGTVVQAKQHVFLDEKQNKRNIKNSKIYRLKLKKEIERLMKDGLDFETSLKRARNYAKYLKYTGR